GKFSKVLAPCQVTKKCPSCRRFLDACPNHRPLAFVLDGSSEEYLEYSQRFQGQLRRAPVRFYSKGDVIGVTRLLNRLYYPDKRAQLIFTSPSRRVVSGARSVFFINSLRNPLFLNAVWDATKRSLDKQSLGLSDKDDLPTFLDQDHW